MKEKIIVIIILSLSIILLGFIDNKLPLFGKIIYLDAGHGGIDKGAIYDGIYESDINLEIVYKLKERLEEKGATVYLTRYQDYDLALPNASLRKRSDLLQRANTINDSNCDLYLSIHLNAYKDPYYSGAQVYYDDINKNNVVLADIMQKVLKEDLKTKREYKLKNDGYMYSRIKKEGILIEVGFLSNSNERYLLTKEEYQYKITDSIVRGLSIYVN